MKPNPLKIVHSTITNKDRQQIAFNEMIRKHQYELQVKRFLNKQKKAANYKNQNS